MRHQAGRGFTLIEVLVALAIGLFLIAGLVAVMQRCRTLYAATESLAQVQDSARHALGVMVSDLEHAGFYGASSPARVELLSAGSVVAHDEALRQPDATRTVTAAPGLPAGSHACGVNFAVDLSLPVEAADNQYRLGVDPSDCKPTASAGGASDGADTLTVRHASLQTTTARPGRLQLFSRALASLGPVQMFADGRAPSPRETGDEIRDLEVRSYYVSTHSVGRTNWPALRVKALTESRGAAQFRDEEVMPGVEDLQVELGVRNEAGGESLLDFLPADSPRVRREPVVAVRLWLRVRAEDTEPGYRDPRPLAYANAVFEPDDTQARQRRILVSRTVALRSAIQ
jgi:type IV pilus assembly protein PilW